MRLLGKLTRLGQQFLKIQRIDDAHATPHGLRICRVEEFEPRMLMTATAPAIIVGGTEYEQAAGNDTQPNIFTVTFEGGAAGTQLTHLEIDGSKSGGPLFFNDAIFDTAAGGLGSYGYHPIDIVSHDGFQVLDSSAPDGSTLLTMDFSGFKAGMTLVFTVDVDQVIYVDPVTSAVDVDAVDEGAEFQRSHFTADFTAPHYQDATVSTQYWDVYGPNITSSEQQAGTNIDLPDDPYTNTAATSSLLAADGSGADAPELSDVSDLTAGAVAVLQQVPLPADLAGVVYEDHNLNNQLNAGDEGVAGVKLSLWQLEGTAYVDTGLTTTTDAQGNYKFSNLLPGEYQVVKTNPAGYFSVGATAGNVAGTVDAQVTSPDVISQITLQGGDDSESNNFALALPATLSGFVYHDQNDDGQREAGEPGIGGVTLSIVPVNVIGTAPAPIQVVTAADGSYSVGGLNPGTWKIVELTQPAGYLDGLARAGTAGGTAVNPGDEIDNISLGDNQSGAEYDFGKLLPNSIAGRVLVSDTLDCTQDPNPTPLAGVTVELLNSTGQMISTTTTDSQGDYQFTALPPGTYSVEDVQPVGYIPGCSVVGSVGGTSVNHNLISTIQVISDIHGTGYNFYEHPYSSVSGTVRVDSTGDGKNNASDPPLAGVTLQLLDSANNVLQTTVSDSSGRYSFGTLVPGTYSVREMQPNGYFFEVAYPGTVGGDAADNHDIDQIVLPLATDAKDYNFYLVQPASLTGKVMIGTTPDCAGQYTLPGVAGVTVNLINSAGQTVATTVTDSKGDYAFNNLTPGTYTVEDVQPDGYYAVAASPGDAGGTVVNLNDIAGATLQPGQAAMCYDFYMAPPPSLTGKVMIGTTPDCAGQFTLPGVAGVTVNLINSAGQIVATTVTDSQGDYAFKNITPGTYTVADVQPDGYFAVAASVGDAGGTVADLNDITGVTLTPGQAAMCYDFYIEPPASLTGKVMVSNTPDCAGQYTLPGVAGVTVELLNTANQIVATTVTDSNGNYAFNNLRPGNYTVADIQPAGFFAVAAAPGDAGGTVADLNDITGVTLGAGQNAMCYDFYVTPPATLSGTVFQDGPAIAVIGNQAVDVPAVRDGVLRAGDLRIAGVTLELRDGVTGAPILGSQALAGTYPPDSPIRVVTDANGDYSFTGLPAGNYAVFEVRPAGYLDGITRAGSTGGVVVGPYAQTAPAVLDALSVPAPADAILQITVMAGSSSVNNNFSVVATDLFVYLPPTAPPVPPVGSADMYALVTTPQIQAPQPLTLATPNVYSGSSPIAGFSWHLSVIDAGQPRGPGASEPLIKLTAAEADELAWTVGGMQDSEWTLGDNSKGPAAGQRARRALFGMKDGVPVAGDFNGDGVADLGVFKDGQWFIDLNGNGVWDEGDLWAKLGYEGDKPVVGDWDGDGKDDIGIFGRAWAGDPKAIAHEPGMPDSNNNKYNGLEKNVPPPLDKAAMGVRSLKRTSQGETRADVIDHVFHYGTPRDFPVVGDWNGDGTDTIAVFSDGWWYQDVDGDGKWTTDDKTVEFGNAGDVPVVGDFNGDGVDEVGVFRGGVFYLDTNGNGKLDSQDEVIRVGEAGDVPVVGDWDGDGRDEVGVYRDGNIANHTARKAG
jgi:serine-aspartate repeat-containing protein C/D/E